MTFPSRALLITKGYSCSAVSTDPHFYPVSHRGALLAPRTSTTGCERSVVTPVVGAGTWASRQETDVAQGVEFLSIPLTPTLHFLYSEASPRHPI